MIRIAFDAKRIFNNQTGLGNYARSLVQNLHRFQPQIALDLYTPKVSIYEDFLLDQGKVNRYVPKKFMHKNLPSLWRNRWLVKELEARGTQIYHGLSNEIPVGMEHTSIKTVVTIHDLIFMRQPQQYNWLDRKLYFNKTQLALKHANIIIAASKQTKDDIHHFFKVDDAKVKVVYQDCDPQFQRRFSQVDLKTIAQKYQLPQSFVLTVGSIEQRKNHLNLLKAFHQAQLPEEVQLVIVGKKGDAYEGLQQFIALNQMQNRIQFIHDIDYVDLPGIYQLSQVFAYISNFEGFGIPVLEGLRSEIPVITSNISSMPEVAGKASILVDPSQTMAIKYALEQSFSNPTLRQHCVQKGIIQAKAFEGENLTKQLMQIYESLLQ